jgi:sugar phosphate isomerase/epimerase
VRDIAISTSFVGEFVPEIHLPAVAKAGFRQVELSGNCASLWRDDKAVAQLRRLLEDTGLVVNSIHSPFQPDYDLSSRSDTARRASVDSAILCLERAAEIGAHCVVQHPSTEPIAADEREIRYHRAVESLRVLSDRLPDGVLLAIEHLPRTCLGHSCEETLSLLDAMGNARCGVCLDVNHANLTEDLAEATLKYGKALFTTHISDNDGKEEKHWEPGRGVIHWAGWVDALDTVGYTGPLLLELSAWGKYPDLPTNLGDKLIYLAQLMREIFGLADLVSA